MLSLCTCPSPPPPAAAASDGRGLGTRLTDHTEPHPPQITFTVATPSQIDLATVDCKDLAFLQRRYDTSVAM